MLGSLGPESSDVDSDCDGGVEPRETVGVGGPAASAERLQERVTIRCKRSSKGRGTHVDGKEGQVV